MTGRFSMKNLMKMDDREIRQGKKSGDSDRLEDFKKKITDDKYLDHAISKLASDLSHYLTK